jgi:hypothetical protein
MKAQNREEKMAKAQEREKLQREIAARERAEKIQVSIASYSCHIFVSRCTTFHRIKLSTILQLQTLTFAQPQSPSLLLFIDGSAIHFASD